MMTLLTKKKFLLAVIIVCATLAFWGRSPYLIAAAAALAIWAFHRLMRRLEGERNWKAIVRGLTDYEEIIGGRLWVGKTAKIFASDRIDLPGEIGPVRFEHICKTESGAWFLFEVAVSNGRIIYRELRPCDEDTARQRLERHVDIYVELFGRPGEVSPKNTIDEQGEQELAGLRQAVALMGFDPARLAKYAMSPGDHVCKQILLSSLVLDTVKLTEGDGENLASWQALLDSLKINPQTSAQGVRTCGTESQG